MGDERLQENNLTKLYASLYNISNKYELGLRSERLKRINEFIKDFSRYKKPFEFQISYKFKKLLESRADQLKKRDLWILLDGREGTGKSNLAVYIAYFYSCLLGREFSTANIYFSARDLVNDAKRQSEKIFIWDEAVVAGMAYEWFNKEQTDLIKFGLMGRVRHHIIIYCIPSMSKLKDYLKFERPHLIIHSYAKQNGEYDGDILVFNEKAIPKMMEEERKNKIKYIDLKNVFLNGYGFHTRVPYVFDKLDCIDVQLYNLKKDRAILSIGEKNEKNFREYDKDEVVEENEELDNEITENEENSKDLDYPFDNKLLTYEDILQLKSYLSKNEEIKTNLKSLSEKERHIKELEIINNIQS